MANRSSSAIGLSNDELEKLAQLNKAAEQKKTEDAIAAAKAAGNPFARAAASAIRKGMVVESQPKSKQDTANDSEPPAESIVPVAARDPLGSSPLFKVVASTPRPVSAMYDGVKLYTSASALLKAIDETPSRSANDDVANDMDNKGSGHADQADQSTNEEIQNNDEDFPWSDDDDFDSDNFDELEELLAEDDDFNLSKFLRLPASSIGSVSSLDLLPRTFSETSHTKDNSDSHAVVLQTQSAASYDQAETTKASVNYEQAETVLSTPPSDTTNMQDAMYLLVDPVDDQHDEKSKSVVIEPNSDYDSFTAAMLGSNATELNSTAMEGSATQQPGRAVSIGSVPRRLDTVIDWKRNSNKSDTSQSTQSENIPNPVLGTVSSARRQEVSKHPLPSTASQPQLGSIGEAAESTAQTIKPVLRRKQSGDPRITHPFNVEYKWRRDSMMLPKEDFMTEEDVENKRIGDLKMRISELCGNDNISKRATKLILEGDLNKIVRIAYVTKNAIARERRYILLDSTLLWAAYVDKKSEKLVVKGRLDVGEYSVFDLPDGMPQGRIAVTNAFGIRSMAKDKVNILIAHDASEKIRWLDAFRQVCYPLNSGQYLH